MQEGLTAIFSLVQIIINTLDSFLLQEGADISFLDYMIGMICSLIVAGVVFAPYIQEGYAEDHAWITFRKSR